MLISSCSYNDFDYEHFNYVQPPDTAQNELTGIISLDTPMIVWNDLCIPFPVTKMSYKDLHISPSPSYELDLRCANIKSIKAGKLSDNLRYAMFSTRTVWPKKLLSEYNPDLVMEIGRNPGLGIRKLHEEGITGKGVSVAIIDQALNVNHIEYCNKIVFYERINCFDHCVSMHGPFVTSTLCGDSIGVAPDVNVFYIAQSDKKQNDNGAFDESLESLIESIIRIIEINEHLSEENRIQVVSISRGFDTSTEEGVRIKEVIDIAKEKNIFVITCSTNINFGFYIEGLGRVAPVRRLIYSRR